MASTKSVTVSPVKEEVRAAHYSAALERAEGECGRREERSTGSIKPNFSHKPRNKNHFRLLLTSMILTYELTSITMKSHTVNDESEREERTGIRITEILEYLHEYLSFSTSPRIPTPPRK